MSGDWDRRTFPWAAEIGLELRVSRFMLPPVMIGRGECGGGGLPEAGDGGDQGDQLVLPVAGPVGDLVLHDADVPCLLRAEVLPGPRGIHEFLPGGALDLGVHQHGPVGAVGEELQRLQDQVRLHPPQQRGPGTGGGAPVLPVIEVPAGDQLRSPLRPGPGADPPGHERGREPAVRPRGQLQRTKLPNGAETDRDPRGSGPRGSSRVAASPCLNPRWGAFIGRTYRSLALTL